MPFNCIDIPNGPEHPKLAIILLMWIGYILFFMSPILLMPRSMTYWVIGLPTLLIGIIAYIKLTDTRKSNIIKLNGRSYNLMEGLLFSHDKKIVVKILRYGTDNIRELMAYGGNLYVLGESGRVGIVQGDEFIDVQFHSTIATIKDGLFVCDGLIYHIGPMNDGRFQSACKLTSVREFKRINISPSDGLIWSVEDNIKIQPLH